jgi:SAM-dependent methyltransferase
MKRIDDQIDHAVLIKGDHDDRARQDFAFAYRNFVTGELMPSNKVVYDYRVKPAFEREHGRSPASSAEIRAAMDEDNYYTFYVSARRTSQELIWHSVVPAVERGLPEAKARAKATPTAGGTLTLDPNVVVPPYVDSLDIHCMPGGYTTNYADDDIAAGAIYDRGVYLYLSGLAGGSNELNGALAAMFLKRTYPDFAPKRILDLGCTVGHSTLPYADMYPDAELYGIDVGAPVLRYAHARAESMGKKAHFHQANAEATPFEAESFDLVMSHIMLHETSTRGLPAIFRECYRLLKPGGLMFHLDQPSFKHLDDYQCFLQENETYYNNEPFWRQYRKIDLGAAAVAAGFPAEGVLEDIVPADVIAQNQNNEKLTPEQAAKKKRGYTVIVARK